MALLAWSGLGALRLSLCVVAVGGLIACGADGKHDSPLPEGTGEISAAILKVPTDTRCVQITGYSSGIAGWNYINVTQDVVPGESATLRIRPVSAGSVVLQGVAYSTDCWSIGYDASDARTWEAEPISLWVLPGQAAEASLTFRRVASVDVKLDFEECICNEDAGCYQSVDGGRTPCVPQQPPGYDAGPAIDAASSDAALTDAGAQPRRDARR